MVEGCRIPSVLGKVTVDPIFSQPRAVYAWPSAVVEHTMALEVIDFNEGLRFCHSAHFGVAQEGVSKTEG